MPFLTYDYSHLEGENRTSFGCLFPGCPGLSQSWFRRFFQTAALRLLGSMLADAPQLVLLLGTGCS
jgi:hypothetical protein